MHRVSARRKPVRASATAGAMIVVALSAALLGLAGCGGDEPEFVPTEDPSSRRTLSQGTVVGFTDQLGGHVWRGIPYATPPVGELRWRAPRPPAPFEGELSALAFGNPCVQFAGPLDSSADEGGTTGDEDCLVLNVFAPKMTAEEAAQAEPLPVMVWIHGGGNTVGSANVYGGSVLATTRGVIVVSMNYRMGVLGWFRHPALRGDGVLAEDASGNFGTLDLVQVLRWVQSEIATFGGDPSRVTLFGESAGGTNVYSMLLSPRAKGLFSRAIVQSGGLGWASIADAENPIDAEEPGHAASSAEVLYGLMVDDGTAVDRAAAKAKVADMEPDAVATYLRGVPAERLLARFDGEGFGGMYRLPMLFPDGVVLPNEGPHAALASGNYNRVPTIAGTNRDEMRLFALFGSPHITSVFRIPLWVNDARRYTLEAEYPSLFWKARGVDEPLSSMREVQGPSVYGYRFDWDEEPKIAFADLSIMLGAAHGLEIPFVFGRLTFLGLDRLIFSDDARPAAEALSKAMTSYWTQFAYTGDPGRGREGDLPHWTAWQNGPSAPRYILLDTEAGGGLRMASETVTKAGVLAQLATDTRFQSAEERCVVYRGFVQFSDAMTAADYEEVDGGACRAFPLAD